MEKQFFEIYENFQPVFNTAKVLIKERGEVEIFNIITGSKISVENTEFDNWNGGTYVYTVYMGLSVKKYSALSSEMIVRIEGVFASSLNEVKNDNSSYFIVKIIPVLSKTDIDWDTIGGLTEKAKLKQRIETVKNIMISVATGGNMVKEEENRYKKLQEEIINDCKKLNLSYNNFYTSLWDWHGKWRADFPTYQERRIYINQLFASTLSYFEEVEFSQNIETFVELNEWERIERTIAKIKRDSSTAKNEEDFQAIGLLCRDVIISLAQAVYKPLIHGEIDENGIKIGKSDAVRMLGNYINFTLKGGQNKELRTYAKVTNDLANQLTHKRSATKKDMLLTMSSTVALINFVGIIEKES